MKIDKELVQYIARLARLSLTEDELLEYKDSLSTIVAYIDALGQINTEQIEPTSHAIPLYNVYRDDEVQQILEQEDILNNAPISENGYFEFQE